LNSKAGFIRIKKIFDGVHFFLDKELLFSYTVEK